MLWVLRRYEEVSGQMIIREKAFFYLHEEIPLVVGIKLRKLIECHVYYRMKNKVHYEDILRKIAKRIICWQNRTGGEREKH
ncbi:hypothetical protein H5410_047075 [Solanum commersonii]|uniref:Uncharacterized protein n=1 Tax=Solanum commersonii TaxID=4109 RepID=A0A9J5XE10_SOLCO|nr:hypothetical protein H5410_047075 [Solanum commersonii]